MKKYIPLIYMTAQGLRSDIIIYSINHEKGGIFYPQMTQMDADERHEAEGPWILGRVGRPGGPALWFKGGYTGWEIQRTQRKPRQRSQRINAGEPAVIR